MNTTKPKPPVTETLAERTFFLLAARFRRLTAQLMTREFPGLALELSNASVRREADEKLAWHIHDAPGNRTGGVYELMRDLPRLWEQSVDVDELAEWVKDAKRLARGLA